MKLHLLPIFVCIMRTVGLCNMRYVADRNRFELVNGFMLFYGLFINFLYLVGTPVILLVMVYSYFTCQYMDLLSVVLSCVGLAKSVSVFVTFGSIWMRRRGIRRFCNRVLTLLSGQRQYHLNYSFWRRHFWKLLLTSARFSALAHQLYGPGSALMCGEDDEVLTEVSPVYLILSVWALFMEILLTCTDSMAYFAQATNNRLLECISQELKALIQDVGLMSSHPGSHRKVYQRQLFDAWEHLWRNCLQLDDLVKEVLKIFEAQMLLTLFTSYLTLIAITFNLVLLIADAEYISVWRCYVYSLVCITFHLETMSYFSIFDTNDDQWKKFSRRLQHLWIIINAANRDDDENIHGVAIKRKLEFAMVFLNCKTQLQPRRFRRLQMLGLFDLNKATWNSMNASIWLNVLILWQLAYKFYY